MIEEFKRRRLDEFEAALEAEGYEVVAAEPQLRDSISKRIAGEEDDTVGFVVVETPVELEGVEFEGEFVITVFKDRIAHHGVDVYSRPDDPLSEEERALLDDLVPPREVDDDGETRLVWSYYPPPADLPGDLGESRDNVDDLLSEFEDVYDRVLQRVD